jgi:hypothetical protein
MNKDRESNYHWGRHGEPVVCVIANAAQIKEEPATDVQKIFEDRHADFDMQAMGEEYEFASDSHYEEKGSDDIELLEEWRYFEESPKTETRFFNKRAARDDWGRLSRDEVLIAVNIAKLPSVPRQILKDIPRPPNSARRDD